MDFSKLSSNEKLAVYGSVAALVGGLVGGTVSSLGWLAFLAAIAMLAVVFMPQFSPTTTLPGSKGSLMLILGAVAGIIMVLGFLSIIGLLGYYFDFSPINAIFFLIGVIGGVVMAWAGWQEFQAEGGKFQIGAASSGGAAATTPAATPPPAAPTQTAAPSATPPPAAAAPPPAAPPAYEPPTSSAPTSSAPPSSASPSSEPPSSTEPGGTNNP
jgi:hypothetical protein